MSRTALLLALGLLTIGESAAQTRLLRMPTISRDHVAFVYAGDVWIANRSGGDARRLTTFDGAETWPFLSPDGRTVAFSGQYDGNTDVYVVPVEGGEPTRLTWHPAGDVVRGWTPDGRSILFESGRDNAPIPIGRFFTVPASGGFPEALPLDRAHRGSFSPDGTRLAYQMVQPWEEEFRNYRGGQNGPIRILDLESLDVRTVPWDPDERSNDQQPAWLGDTVHFLSDRDYAMNVWAFDDGTGEVRQLTHFTEFDSKNLSAGGGALVFENGGWLYTLDPEAGEPERLDITVRGDFPWARPHWEDVAGAIQSGRVSPSGKRALFEARGDIFTVPAEKGDVRNLTGTPGVADRAPAWSPDGHHIAWFSDESGEYALVVADQYGRERRVIGLESPTYFYAPVWSPDSKRIAFTDADRVLWVVDVAGGKQTRVDTEGTAHPERNIDPEWSPDSRWIAYTRGLPNLYNAVFLYDVESGGEPVQLTDGLSNSLQPVFDAEGEYLYFLSSTDYGLATGWLDMTSYPFRANYAVYVAVLSAEAEHPFAPESDDEPEEGGGDDGEEEGEGDEDEDGDDEEDEDEEKDDEPEAVRIDFDGIGSRVLALDMPARRYVDLEPGKEGTLFAVANEEGKPELTLYRFSVEDREAKEVMGGITGFDVSADGSKLIYVAPGDTWGLVDASGEAKVGDGKLDTGNMRAQVDPPAEWRQIFREAVRFQRDYFYVDNVHGLDLAWAERTYGAWLEDVRHRDDLNYLLDILGGETAIGHSFVGGGDSPDVESVPMGLLGADFVVEDGRYRIKRIYTGEDWNPNLRGPLSGPGIDAREGDWIVAVDGEPLAAAENIYGRFERTAGRQVRLTLNGRPTADGAREVTVVPVPSESGLRRQAWVEGNRRRVDELSGGRLGYVWLPNTGGGGYANFNRYYFAQQDRQGAVIDERFNGGGSAADYMVELMDRELMGYFNNPVGDRRPWTTPMAGIWGPKVMIINDAAGSGGDLLPYMFRLRGIGPLVGTRTWGGLVGIWDVPRFIDGGGMTAPRGGFFDLGGEWAVENEGVPPDIEVQMDPKAVAAGRDPQLEEAVRVALELLGTESFTLPAQPPDPVRVRRPER
jgi:tricorn protease